MWHPLRLQHRYLPVFSRWRKTTSCRRPIGAIPTRSHGVLVVTPSQAYHSMDQAQAQYQTLTNHSPIMRTAPVFPPQQYPSQVSSSTTPFLKQVLVISSRHYGHKKSRWIATRHIKPLSIWAQVLGYGGFTHVRFDAHNNSRTVRHLPLTNLKLASSWMFLPTGLSSLHQHPPSRTI